MPEEEYKNASEGWDYALRVLKKKQKTRIKNTMTIAFLTR
jgi:hypothetical protein